MRRANTTRFDGGRVCRRGVLEEVPVLVEGGRIKAVGAAARARGAERVDLAGAILAPGFVDLHTHGAAGIAFDGASPDAIDAVVREHYIPHGVTRMLVSLCPAPPGRLVEAVGRVAAAVRSRAGHGAVAGIHLEGPFLNPKRPGALPVRAFRTYDADLVDRLLDAGRGTVKTMTLAPERPRGQDLVAHLRRRRVVPAFGHSAASHADARAAIGGGIRYVTHLFNAMNGIHHRAPGPVTAFLEDPRVRVELISDGFHVAPEVMRWVARLKAPETICLVSDSVGPCGLEPGRYEFAGHDVTLRDGRVTMADGTLAGSALTMDEAVRVQVGQVGRPVAEVSVSASLTPARVVGWHRQLGAIEPGLRADLVVLGKGLRVEETWIGGRRRYRRGDGPSR